MLIKESLQLNHALTAIDNRFKSVFGRGEVPGLNELVANFNMTETSAKRTLSTIGEFAKGLGQSQKYVKTFSTDLAKAAADFAAYKGLEDVEEVAKKFAKATLGEVGELKDIGIVIDLQSQSFKNLTASIMEATGASEAQAKQMAITQEILRQVEHTSGSAAGQIFDGWTQLNLLMDQFKEVLADVGGIFSAVFGPVLSGLNAILAIPFVKSTVAWTVALTAVGVGYGYLISTLTKLKKILRGNAEAEKLTTSQVAKALETQKMYLALKEQQLAATEKILEYEKSSAELAEKLKRKGLRKNEPGTKEAAERASLASLASRQRKKVKEPAEAALADLEKSLDSLSKETLEGIAGISGLDSEFVTLVSTLAAAKTATQLSTGAIIANTIAKKANTLATNFNAISSGLMAGLKAIPSLIGGLFKFIVSGIAGLSKAFIGLFATAGTAAAAAGTTGAAGAAAAGVAGAGGAAAAAGAATTSLTASLGSLAAALGTFLTTLAAVAAAVTIVAMAFEGLWNWLAEGESFIEGFFHGTIATAIADFVANMIWGLDEIEEKSKELDEQIRKSNQDLATLNGLKADLEKIRMDEAMKHLLPGDLAKTLEKRTKEVQAEAKKYEWMIANMGTARQRGMYSLGEGETVSGKRVEFQRKLNELTREQYQLAGQLERATENLRKQLEQIADLDNELIDMQWERAVEQAGPGKAARMLRDDLSDITDEMAATQQRIAYLKRQMELHPDQQGNYTEELIQQQKLFNQLTREQYSTQDRLNRLSEQLRQQLQSIAQAEKEFEKLQLDRLLAKALPREAIFQLRRSIADYDFQISATMREIGNLRAAMVRNPSEKGNYTEALLNSQRKLIELTRQRYAAEDSLARQQQRIITLNKEFSDQLAKVSQNFDEIRESFAWGYNKKGEFSNRTEAVRLQHLERLTHTVSTRLRSLNGRGDVESLKQRQTLMQRYMELVREEGELKLAALERQREAAITNLESMVELVRQAREFRVTAQEGIEANTTEALRLQSRRPGEVNDDALKPVVEQQKAVREIEGRMLEQQRKTTTLLTGINGSLGRVIRTLATKSGATSVDVITAI
jgi:hypothetical protein